MLVLHAGCWKDQFLLWGEISPEGFVQPGRRRGRKPKVPLPNNHPYAADVETLSGMFHHVRAETDRPVFDVVAWLPSRGGLPLPSNPRLMEVDDADQSKPVDLRPWNVVAFSLDPTQAVELLGAGTEGSMLVPGTFFGPDLVFWREALRLAASLTARERFLPGVVANDGGWEARWEPVLLGLDLARLGKLAAAMPGACRALMPAGEVGPPTVPALDLLQSFLGNMVDHLVREAAALDLPVMNRAESLHEQWLHALVAGRKQAALQGSTRELIEFAGQVRAWQRPLEALRRAPVRLCFRLDPPDTESGEDEVKAQVGRQPGRGSESTDRWMVRYLLQANHDPSLVVPVTEVWHGDQVAIEALQRPGCHLREYLFLALGQAARLSPEIEKSLREGEPAGHLLDTRDAYTFLLETAPALEQAGFAVMLPSWWTRRGTKLRIKAQAHVNGSPLQVGQGLTLDSLVQVDWRVALGGQTLALTELEALARLKSPLVRFRGQWVEVDAAEIEQAIGLLQGKTKGRRKTQEQLPLRDVVRMALGATDGDRRLEVDGVAATGPVAELLDHLQGETPVAGLEPPAGFAGTLRPYQLRGYSWLAFLCRWGLGACLADDMGLGKTVQALALIQKLWRRDNRRPVLLACPTSVANNWRQEAERFTPELPVLIHHGTDRLQGTAFAREVRRHALVVTTYPLLHRDLNTLQLVPWLGMILDEAQNIKNPGTQQARAARLLDAGFRLALTGTPVENHVGDLWSIMEFLVPGMLGSLAGFKQRFFVPIQVHRDRAAATHLQRITSPFILRRLKTDKAIIPELPDKIETKVFCTLTREQASLYAAVLQEAELALAEAEDIQRRGLVLATLTKLKQVCNHPAQFLGDGSRLAGRSGKLDRLTEICDVLLSVGDKALVFTQFAEMGSLLRRYLRETFGREVLFLHGGVPKKERDRMVERFQEPNGPPLFILSLKAGGTGLNLTQANHVVHFDRWWNPAVETQATDRAFRIGQNHNVQVHKFMCQGTMEEKIDTLIERKQELSERIVGSGEAWLTELSTRELRQFLALERHAEEE